MQRDGQSVGAVGLTPRESADVRDGLADLYKLRPREDFCRVLRSAARRTKPLVPPRGA